MASLEPEPMERSRLDSKGRVHFMESQITPDHAGQILVSLSCISRSKNRFKLLSDHRWSCTATMRMRTSASCRSTGSTASRSPFPSSLATTSPSRFFLSSPSSALMMIR